MKFLFLLVSVVLLLLGLFGYMEYCENEKLTNDPYNNFITIERIDKSHRIVEFRGKRYIATVTYGNHWTIGAEYNDKE